MLARSRATAALVLGACAGAPGAVTGSAPTATAEMMVDYPYYELEGMVDEASLIVEATVVSSGVRRRDNDLRARRQRPGGPAPRALGG